MTEQTCRHCGGRKPADRYHFKPTRQGNVSSICRECTSREAREKYAAKRAVEVAALGPIEVRSEHRCAMCGVTKPWTPEFFPRQKGAPRGVAYRCRECRRVEQQERYARDPESARRRAKARYDRQMATPEGRAYLNAQSNARSRRWRERNLDAARDAERRWRERIREQERENPDLRAARLERERIDARLRAEREGREIRSLRSAVNAYRMDEGGGAQLMEPEPLAVWLDEVLRREIPDFGVGRGGSARMNRSRTAEDLACELGVPPRRIWSLHHRAQTRVALSTADRMLTNYGRPVVLDGAVLAAGLEARCRAMAGNGERILRYMDLAEQVGHLAGTVVDRIEDLWPSLEDVG